VSFTYQSYDSPSVIFAILNAHHSLFPETEGIIVQVSFELADTVAGDVICDEVVVDVVVDGIVLVVASTFGRLASIFDIFGQNLNEFFNFSDQLAISIIRENCSKTFSLDPIQIARGIVFSITIV